MSEISIISRINCGGINLWAGNKMNNIFSIAPLNIYNNVLKPKVKSLRVHLDRERTNVKFFGDGLKWVLYFLFRICFIFFKLFLFNLLFESLGCIFTFRGKYISWIMYINKEKKLVIVTVNLQFLTKVLKTLQISHFLHFLPSQENQFVSTPVLLIFGRRWGKTTTRR